MTKAKNERGLTEKKATIRSDDKRHQDVRGMKLIY